MKKSLLIAFFLIFSLDLFSFNFSSGNISIYNYLQQEDKSIKEKKTYPKRLKRSESFFGLHFDFHASDDCKEIGKNTTPEMVQAIIDKTHPDFIQIDCKGHPGLSSYPTKVGNQAPGFMGDPLRIWREVTAKNGIALYMHYSGVYDNAAVKKDSTWARVNPDGLRDKNMNSVYGPYVDKLLIPQFKELSDVYGVDGVWVDGDCWAAANEYGENVLKFFKDKTGIQSIPRKYDDPYYFEFTEFNREGYKNYVKHYVDEMHKHNPNFQVASNWSFTSFMPEPVSIDVDFISGDFNYDNSVNSARLEGRCIAKQGKPWDLMSWGFRYRQGNYHNQKSAIQLKQEAAIIMALGGGFQVYSTQNRDGSVSLWKLNTLEEIGKFCRDRQKICQNVESIPQIALLYSKEDFYRRIKSLFGGWAEGSSMKGVLYALLDAQNSVEILSEHHLKGRMKDYPLIVIPEIQFLDPKFKEELLTYAKDGGNILIIGHDASGLFKDDLKFSYKGEIDKNASQWLEFNNILTVVQAPYQSVLLDQGMKPIGKLLKSQDPKTPSEISASSITYGKGKIAAIFFDLGAQYFKGSSSFLRDYLNSFVRDLFPDPIVEIKGSHYIDITLNRIKENFLVNLVNTAGPHNGNAVDAFDEIPSVGPLEISIRYKNKPKKITLEPGGKILQYKYVNDKIKVTIPKVDIHEIISIN